MCLLTFESPALLALPRLSSFPNAFLRASPNILKLVEEDGEMCNNLLLKTENDCDGISKANIVYNLMNRRSILKSVN